MNTLIIDNYDSFTYNLAEFVRQCGLTQFDVYRNDQITVAECAKYDQIIISPGPGVPEDAGIIKTIVKELGPSKRILGICLGMQAIGEVYQCKLTNLPEVFHGRATTIERLDENERIFKGLPRKFKVGRYHSWGIHVADISQEFELLTRDENGIAMAIRHKEFDMVGLQFHPESVLTEHGIQIIANWLNVPEPQMEVCLPASDSAAYDINRIERSLFL